MGRGTCRWWAQARAAGAEGRRGGQFWSVYVPCETQNKDAVKRTLEQIDVVHRMCELYPETFACVVDSAGERARVPRSGGTWVPP